MGFFVLNKKLPAKRPLLERLANLLLVCLDLRFEVLAATRKAFAIRRLAYDIWDSRFKLGYSSKDARVSFQARNGPNKRRALYAYAGVVNNRGTEVGNPGQRPVAFLSGLMLKS